MSIGVFAVRLVAPCKRNARYFLALPLALVFTLVLPSLPVQAAGRDDLPQSAPDVFGGYPSTRILVQLRSTTARTALAAMRARAEARRSNKPAAAAQRGQLVLDSPDAFSAALQRTWRRWGATRLRPVFSGSFLHAKRAIEYGLDRMFVIEVPSGTDTPAMARSFAAHAAEVEAAGVSAIGGVAACPTLPNDDRFLQQWNMHNIGQTIFNVRGTVDADIDAPEAWEITTGDPGATVIAIVDSGVYPHPDFADRMLPGHNAVPGADPDDTLDYCGSGHGTHVTGIAAATGNDGSGVAGVNWGTSILPIKVLGPPHQPNPCSGFLEDLVAGLEWAVDWPCFDQLPCDDTRRVDVINMSLQYYSLDPLAVALVTNAVNMAHSQDIVVVAATGNYGTDVGYPAKLNNVIAVGMTDNRDGISSDSNHGPEVDLSAPGDDVYSTFRNNSFGWLAGTSMATPHVSGLASLLRSLDPTLTNDEIEVIMEDSAEDKGTPGWDEYFGYGRINAYRALATALGGILSSSPPTCSVDAPGKPHEPDDPLMRYGWQSVELTFPGDVSGLSPADFAVVAEGSSASAPVVAAVTATGATTVRIDLDVPILPAAWTRVEHMDSGTSVRLGFLPGDVNGDEASNTADILALVDNLEGVGVALPLSSLDMDRSGAFDQLDLLELVDLLVGAGAYEPYLDATLPP